MRFHLDSRGSRYCDIFSEAGVFGDVNVTIVNPGTAALWHRHEKQDDYQIVVKGALQISMCNLPYDPPAKEKIEWRNRANNLDLDHLHLAPYYEDEKWQIPHCEHHILSERNANEGPLFVPRGFWHGCFNHTNEEAILIYYISNHYDGTDEARMTVERAGWDYERVAK